MPFFEDHHLLFQNQDKTRVGLASSGSRCFFWWRNGEPGGSAAVAGWLRSLHGCPTQVTGSEPHRLRPDTCTLLLRPTELSPLSGHRAPEAAPARPPESQPASLGLSSPFSNDEDDFHPTETWIFRKERKAMEMRGAVGGGIQKQGARLVPRSEIPCARAPSRGRRKEIT